MPLSDTPVGAAALVAAVDAAGGVAAEAGVMLGGRWGGEMLDRFALDNLLYALAEVTEPSAPAPAMVPDDGTQLDAWLTSGTPPSPN